MGGLVGRMDRATVEQCSVNLEISGSYNTVGGLIGQMSNGHQFENVVKDSYAVGKYQRKYEQWCAWRSNWMAQ